MKLLALLLVCLLAAPSAFAMGWRRGPSEPKASKEAMTCETDRRIQVNNNRIVSNPIWTPFATAGNVKLEARKLDIQALEDGVEHKCLDHDACPIVGTACFGI